MSAVVSTRVAVAKPGKPVEPLTRINAHYRKFLRSRSLNLIVRAAVITTLSFAITPAILLGLKYSFLSAFLTVCVGPLLYVASIHWVLRVRQGWIIKPPHLKSPASRLCMGLSTLFSLPSLAIFLAYAWCTTVFTIFYGFLVNNLKPSSNLSLLEPTKRAPHHGNERVWFLVFGNFCFAMLFALRDLIKDKNYPQWPKKTNINFTDAVKNEIVDVFRGPLWVDVTASAIFTFAFTALYRTFRGWAWRWLVSYVSFSRPFILNFAKTSRTSVTWSLGWYLLVSEISLLFILKPTLGVLDTYMTQPLNFASFTRQSPLSPESYLLEAMKSHDPFYLDHTVMEIQRLIHSKAKRAIFFADPGKPSLTHELYRVMLIQLGRVYSSLTVTDLKSAQKETPAAPAQPDPRTVTIKSADIFRPPPKKTGIQALVSTIVETQPRPTPAPIREAAHVIHEKELSLLKKAEEPVKQAEQWASTLPVVGPALSWVRDVRGCYADWAGREWARRRVFNGVPEFDRFNRVVDILTTMTCASATEDQYGAVQAVLPATLEALVRVRWGAVGLQNRLLKEAPKVSDSATDGVRDQIDRVTSVVDEGIRTIVDRFGTSLTSAFTFPTDVAAELTRICQA